MLFLFLHGLHVSKLVSVENYDFVGRGIRIYLTEFLRVFVVSTIQFQSLTFIT